MYWNYIMIITCICLTTCEILVPPIEGDLDWWQNSIIYEIFPLSFKDSNGDGSGDFKGITEKLDYLVDIGVNAIWLTPFFESPLESGGYDISNYLNVQKVFGTLDDFKDLLDTAHTKNIRVIMDFVPNHTSDKHNWYKSSVNNRTGPYGDYYIWKNAKNHDEVMKNSSVTPIVPNNWKRICANGEDNSAWIWHNTRQQFYFVQFSGDLPDLNFRNEQVHKEMKNILNYWIGLGIDGIRIDALKHLYESENLFDEPIIDSSKPADYSNMNHVYTVDQDEVYDIIKNWHQLLNEFKQKDGHSRIIMAESYSPQKVLFKYYTSGVEIPTDFYLLFNFPISAKNYDDSIKYWITNMPKGATYNVVLQNHDEKRFPTLYGAQLINGINALSLFLPGVAIVYYGGEIGMEDISDNINFARSPMQWDDIKYSGFTTNIKGPWVQVNEDYVTRNVKTEYKDPKSYLNFFKSISKLRQTETMKRGGLATYIFNNTVFVLNRFLPKSVNYTLLINLNSKYSQNICLSDQIQNIKSHLIVVIESGNSEKFTPGNSISTKSLTLSPGATIILTDDMSNYTLNSTTTTSCSVQFNSTYIFKFNILFVFVLLNFINYNLIENV